MFSVVAAGTYSHDVKVAEEFRPRGGLPNTFGRLQGGQALRIAYLGGSITAANGWRPKTLDWFRGRWPAANIQEINAAISGTGSDYGACRLKGDVLAQDPDLVLMEFRSNGGGGFEAQSVEGIVRQIWQHNPRADICFVYTVSHWMLNDLREGRSPGFSCVMETVANAYGIPTIDLGVEIIRREKEGTLVFKSTDDVPGKVVFSNDGVHPGDAGHEMYRDIVIRSLQKIELQARTTPHTMPVPLQTTRWETAGLLPITQCQLSGGWVAVDRLSDPTYRDDPGRTDAMLRGAVRCNQVGQTITVRWSGTTIGMSDIPYGDGSTIEAAIDGGQPIVIKRAQTEKRRKYARFWYLPEQKPGPHTAVFTVKQIPLDGWVYAGQVLVVGTAQ